MPKSLFIFYFLLCFNVDNLHAQSKGFVYADTTILEDNKILQSGSGEEDYSTDTILYQHLITISQDSIDSWKNDKKFSYAKNLDSLLQLKEKEAEEQNNFQSSSRQSSPSFLQSFLSSGFVQVFFWIVAIAVVLFVLYKLVLSKGNFIFRKSKTASQVNEVSEQTNITDAADYDALIQQSYAQANYRMAVRYLFLKTLLKLSDKRILHHSADKTNFQYVQEIAIDKRNDFANLVLNYEYIWYGKLDISSEQYSLIEKKYTTFNNKI